MRETAPTAAYRPVPRASPVPRRRRSRSRSCGLGRRQANARIREHRQDVDLAHELVEAQRIARDVERRDRLQAFDVAPERAAQGRELGTLEPREAAIGGLQGVERSGHVAGDLQLLQGEVDHALDVDQRRLVATTRKLEVQLVEIGTLRLDLRQCLLELRDLLARIASLLARRGQRRLGLGIGLALRGELLLQRLLAALQIEVGDSDQQREQQRRADLPPAHARAIVRPLGDSRQHRHRDIDGSGVRRWAGGRVVVHG